MMLIEVDIRENLLQLQRYTLEKEIRRHFFIPLIQLLHFSRYNC